MPTYGTKVPYNGHICALSGAMIQKGKNFPSFKRQKNSSIRLSCIS